MSRSFSDRGEGEKRSRKEEDGACKKPTTAGAILKNQRKWKFLGVWSVDSQGCGEPCGQKERKGSLCLFW
jgi:hypothetical protein